VALSIDLAWQKCEGDTARDQWDKQSDRV